MGIDRNNAILNMMYRGTTTIEDFNWDAMTTVPILYLMTPQDIDYIKNLILSPRYSGNNKYKMEKIDEIMHLRGFSRFAGGTNRLVYIHPSAPNAVFKVAIDSVGINDNPAEFRNQNFLKPYCCKVFECTPCGTIASFEKVDRITTFEEFYTIADDYYYIIVNVILGKYVMDDIGIDYFMNIGIRVGCHPVLLDFPYLFELDGRKLECCNVLDDGRVCGGEIDYDGGFNKLVCKKCGRVFRARDLAKPPKEGGILLRQKGGRRMKLEITRGGKVIKTYDTTIERDYLSRNDRDVTNNRVAEVVLNCVEVKTNKVVTPVVHHENTGAHRATQMNTAPVNVKRVVKEIDLSKKSEPVNQATTTTTSKGGVELELTRKVETVAPSQKKIKTVDVSPKKTVVTGPKTEVSHVETAIVNRVVDVSIGRPKTTVDVVKAETTPAHSIEVCVTKSKETVKVETKKEEHIERIDGAPIVKAEVDTPKKVRTVEIDLGKTATVNKTPVHEETPDEVLEEVKPAETVEETIQEVVPAEEVVEEVIATKTEAVMEEELKREEEVIATKPVMQQAIFFGDEPGGYDPAEEEVDVEETPVEEELIVETEEEEHKIPVGQTLRFITALEMINGDPDYIENIIMDYYDKNNIECGLGDIIKIDVTKKISNDDGSADVFETTVRLYACTDPINKTWEPIEMSDDDTPEMEITEVYDYSHDEDEAEPEVVEDNAEQYPVVEPDGDETVEEETSVEADDSTGEEDTDTEVVEVTEEEPATEEEVVVEENDEISESSGDEEELEDEECYQITLVDKKPADDEAEADVFYCLPRHGLVDTSVLDSITDPTDIDLNDFRIYFKVDEWVEQIMFDYDSCSWIVLEDESSMKLDSLKRDKIYIADELLPFDEAEPDIYYLLRVDEKTFDAFVKGEDKYHFCFVVIDEVVDEPIATEEPKVEEKAEEQAEFAPVVTQQSEEQINAATEAMIAQLKASSKKKSLDDLLK